METGIRRTTSSGAELRFAMTESQVEVTSTMPTRCSRVPATNLIVVSAWLSSS
jgi:hypothetical protein